MKHGNSAVPFKELGSSPAKQNIGGDASEALSHWKKFNAAKTQDRAVERLMTNKNISKKAFDTKLAKITKTVNPHAKSTMPKNFNMTGKDTWVQRSKDILNKSKSKTSNILSKTWKNLKSAGKQSLNLAKKYAPAVIKNAPKLARGAGWLGAALTAYDIGKFSYENRDEISENAKKIKKNRVNNPSDHGRPKY